jgi:hypothetical protein
MNVIYRQNHKFIIDESKLKPEARRSDICNALYAALYLEFAGAHTNPDYSKLTSLEKMNKINEYANAWLKEIGLI